MHFGNLDALSHMLYFIKLLKNGYVKKKWIMDLDGYLDFKMD